MRKTWAEYKREARKRQHSKRLVEDRELNTSLFTRPFSDFMTAEGRSGFAAHYLILGHKWWDFDEDSGIEPLSDDALDEDERDAAFNSLGKADLILSVMEDMIAALAGDVAAYKRGEIEARIEKVVKAGLTGPNSAAALDELERLKKMRNQLNKRVRKSLPQWRVTGE